MAKIKGICRNEDCDLCNHIQEADKTDFICGLCHEPLIPFDGGPCSWWKRYKQKVLIGGAAVLLGGGGAATYFLSFTSCAAALDGAASSPIVSSCRARSSRRRPACGSKRCAKPTTDSAWRSWTSSCGVRAT